DTFTYLIAPRWKLSRDLMVYARASSGFRPGSINAPLQVSQGAPIQADPDFTKNYEVGLKASLLDQRLDVDASLYRIDWEDIQLSLATPQGLGYNANGGRAKSEGVDLSAAFRPTGSFTVSGWVSYNNAVITQAFPPTSTVSGRAGDRLVNSPKVSGYLTA